MLVMNPCVGPREGSGFGCSGSPLVCVVFSNGQVSSLCVEVSV